MGAGKVSNGLLWHMETKTEGKTEKKKERNGDSERRTFIQNNNAVVGTRMRARRPCVLLTTKRHRKERVSE